MAQNYSTTSSILDQPIVYSKPDMDYQGSLESDLVDSEQVLHYYDGTPIAMVNIKGLMIIFMEYYGYLDVDRMLDSDISLTLRDTLQIISNYDVDPIATIDVNVLLTTLRDIYGHDTIQDLMNENPSYSIRDLIDVLYRYGAR